MQRIPTSSSDTVKLESFALSLFKDYLCLPEITNSLLVFALVCRNVLDAAEQKFFDS